MVYSREFKSRKVAKMLPPNGTSSGMVSSEQGNASPSLSSSRRLGSWRQSCCCLGPGCVRQDSGVGATLAATGQVVVAMSRSPLASDPGMGDSSAAELPEGQR